MKLKDIEGVPVKNIKVKLPELYYNSANQFDKEDPIVNKEVWLVGPLMGDWFVKNDREEDRIFPLMFEFIPWSDLAEWEVIEVRKNEKKKET